MNAKDGAMAKLDEVFDQVIKDKIRTIPDKAKLIQTAQDRGRLLAVRGNYDYVEKILPHCYASQKLLINANDNPPQLDNFDVVFIGCPGTLPVYIWEKQLFAFLNGGGVLLTTDWCLGNLIQKLFPKQIRQNGSASGSFPLRVLQPSHPLLEGISDCNGTPWVVETASHRIGIVDAKHVVTILDAPGMGHPSAVLVAFEVGKGMVVHAISHFHLQGSARKGEYVSAYILTNVIDEAMRRRHPQAASRIRVVNEEEKTRPLRIRVLNGN
jgi:hypothetical protein